ncbi:Uncharacterized protein B5E38_1839 [Bacillus cereus]|nr:Uncharacterized protein B5E38_1839 [Bacillus cereus]ARO63853.1 Uncharacterized protein B5E39_1395 [Bacillus cereus]
MRTINRILIFTVCIMFILLIGVSSTIRLEDKLLLIGLSLICNVIAYFTVEYIYKRIDNKKKNWIYNSQNSFNI